MINWGVELNNVTANWGPPARNILENLTFKLEIPQTALMFPLMGPSGQGKSTLLYLLAALKWPTAGTIRWTFPNGKVFAWGARGQMIHPHSSNDAVTLRRSYFGFAFQSSTLSPYLTVLENVAYPLTLQGTEWLEALDTAELTLNEVLLPNEKAAEQQRLAFLHGFHTQLSGGQRQRVALAQAMVHDPYVLFADEPTGQLDLHTRRQVMTVLRRWVEKNPGQRCLIWVTHHHLGDLDLMGIDHLIFVNNQSIIEETRADLERWIRL
jgi:putative ABC transport system ATP-binding protein